MNKKLKVILITIAALFLLAACNSGDDKDSNGDGVNESEQDNGATGQVEPNLEDVPDVVAVVNGEEITREEFEFTYTSEFQRALIEAQMSGQQFSGQLDKKELTRSMIDLELLIQEAGNRNLTPTDQEVDDNIAEIAEANDLESVEELFEVYDEQGMSEERLRQEVAAQIKLRRLIEDEGKDITISEAQVEELYDEMIAVYEEMAEGGSVEDEGELPTIEDLRADLEEHIWLNEENKLIIELIEKLRDDAEIVNHM